MCKVFSDFLAVTSLMYKVQLQREISLHLVGQPAKLELRKYARHQSHEQLQRTATLHISISFTTWPWRMTASYSNNMHCPMFMPLSACVSQENISETKGDKAMITINNNNGLFLFAAQTRNWNSCFRICHRTFDCKYSSITLDISKEDHFIPLRTTVRVVKIRVKTAIQNIAYYVKLCH